MRRAGARQRVIRTQEKSGRRIGVLRQSHLSESFGCDPPVVVFFRLGVGMRHSIENATQLVHGTPRLAASHRT